MATSSLDRGRITARVPLHVQETLETAALLVGSTVNQFVVQAALSAAERIIEQERVIRLSADDARYFLDALDNPLPPNNQLMSALQATPFPTNISLSHRLPVWPGMPRRRP